MLKYGVQLKFPVTNNEAEYEGILTGLRLGKALGAKNLLIQSDSKLVIRQIRVRYIGVYADPNESEYGG